jgi:hypothetical protein
MRFPTSQLGRFGSLGAKLNIHDDPDHCAANLLAVNGDLTIGRPYVDIILNEKGLLSRDDAAWRSWAQTFATLEKGDPVQADCTRPQAMYRGCWHELIPPIGHRNLRGFARDVLPLLDDQVVVRPDGTTTRNEDSSPHIFVVTVEGEILLSPEEWGLVKHPSLTAGRPVQTAGQVWVVNHRIALIDHDSGHYMKSIGKDWGNERLVNFTRSVFTEYNRCFDLDCLDPTFKCVWLSNHV